MLYSKVLQDTTPWCTAQYYSSTIPYCKVLLQYYSVLQSTTLYYKVLPQHYSSATLYYTVLLRTTKYYSSITLHYKVLLCGVLLCTTKALSSASLCYTVLLLAPLCALQRRGPFMTCHWQWVLRGATGVIVQPHQIMRLPRKITRMLDSRWLACLIPVTYETSFALCRLTSVTLQPHQILRLPQWPPKIWQKFTENSWNVIYNARPIRAWTRQSATRRATEVTFCARHEHFVLKNTTLRSAYLSKFTKYCACQEKWHLNFTKYCACLETWHLNFTKYCACHAKRLSSLIPVTHGTSFTMRGATGLTLQPHQKYACPAKWLACLILVTYDTSFTMRRATGVTLQPHQILRPPRTMTAENLTEIYWKQLKRHLQCAADPSMIREWSENEPVSPKPAAQLRLLVTLAAEKIQHVALRLSFEISPSTAPATKSDNLTSPSLALATKSDTWTSPGKVTLELHQVLRLPGTVTLELHQVWRLPWKVTLELRQVLRLPRKVTLELHQVLRLSRKVTPELCQVWRLPRKVTIELHQVLACHEKWHLNFAKYGACHEKWQLNFTKYWPVTKSDTWTSPSTAPLSDTRTLPSTLAIPKMMIPIPWRFLLLDASYSLKLPITWSFLLLDDSYYLTSHYLTIPILCRFWTFTCGLPRDIRSSNICWL